MNLEIVAKLIMLMENSSLSTLEVESNGLRVRMESQNSDWDQTPREVKKIDPAALLAMDPSQLATPAPSKIDVLDSIPVNPDEAIAVPGDSEITSPMVGTFHELKNHPVKIGSELKAGDTVCIIEAMKVMNEIVIEEDGIITWIACSEGDMAEYGQVLFKYTAI